MSHRDEPPIAIDDPAVQAACAAILYELLRSGSWEDRYRRPAHVPAMLAELKLTPAWRRALVAAVRWMCDEGTSAPAFLRPRGYETSLLPEVLRGFVSTQLEDALRRVCSRCGVCVRNLGIVGECCRVLI